MLTILVVNGLFLFWDRVLKLAATHLWCQPNLINKFFGWQPYFNHGIGFGIPIPNIITITLSLVIMFFIIYLIIVGVDVEKKFYKTFALSLIFTGAVSNFLDRTLYHYTIDYFLIVTSLINLADVFIVTGFVLYLLQVIKQK